MEDFAVSAMEDGFGEAIFEAVRSHPTHAELHLHAWLLLSTLTRLNDGVQNYDPARRERHLAALTRVKQPVAEIVQAAKAAHPGLSQVLVHAQTVLDQWERIGMVTG